MGDVFWSDDVEPSRGLQFMCPNTACWFAEGESCNCGCELVDALAANLATPWERWRLDRINEELEILNARVSDLLTEKQNITAGL